MARIEISSVSNPYGTGELQLQGKVAMSGTLTAVTDNLNNASPLKLSTGGVQVASTLQITTNSNPYIDAEDGSGNNRFQVGRDPSSQVVNVDFASNPTGGTNQVGAIRTYTDGVSLSNVMSFRKDGNVGVGVTSSALLTGQLSVGNTDFVIGANAGYSTYYGSSINGTIQATSSGSTTQLWFRANGNALNENDNYWSRIEQVQGGAMRILASRYGSLVLGNIGYNNAITLYNSSAFTMPKVGINNATPSALLQIAGTGSTSATTSLLVQNSAGTNLLQQKDNGELFIGTTASGLGQIVVPHDSVYGERVFMKIQAGVNLMSTYSNDGLGFKANYNIFSGYIYNNSGYFLGANTGSGTDTSAYFLSTQLNPYGGANSNLIHLNGGGRLQGGASGNYIQVSGNMQLDSPVNILRGFYFNPTLSGAYSNANVFAVHSTYGGAYLNTATPNASAILQADSTTQGFLPPRMTDAEIRAIVSPANGLIAYNTDINHLCCYQAGAWVKFSHSPM